MSDRLPLLLAAFGLVPIALSYGVMPTSSVTYLFGFTVDGVNHVHVFRAIMGLYLANAVFWLVGAFNAELRIPALWCLLVFMLGLAAGRVLSIIIDGVPGVVLILYLVAEIVFGTLAYGALKRNSVEKGVP